MRISEIQKMNVVWVIGSFTLLYYGVTGNLEDLVSSFVWISLLFCAMLYMGIKSKKENFEKDYLVGEKAKGQWER